MQVLMLGSFFGTSRRFRHVARWVRAELEGVRGVRLRIIDRPSREDLRRAVGTGRGPFVCLVDCDFEGAPEPRRGRALLSTLGGSGIAAVFFLGMPPYMAKALRHAEQLSPVGTRADARALVQRLSEWAEPFAQGPPVAARARDLDLQTLRELKSGGWGPWSGQESA